MRRPRLIIVLLLIFLPTIYSSHSMDIDKSKREVHLDNLLSDADSLFIIQKYSDAISIYEKIQPKEIIQKPPVLKKIALSYAAVGNASASAEYIEEYLFKEFKPTVLLEDGFDAIQKSVEFREIERKYKPKFTIWSFLYLYVAFIGLYISIIINFNKKIDNVSRILISSFIFIHSFFILHISINITNYHYQFPHTYLMSTSFSFLYGPLLYFYFKRITEQYRFKITDALHLIPTILFLMYIIPIYSMTASEKLSLMLERSDKGFNAADSSQVAIIVGLKLISLIVYGYFIRKVYIKSKQQKGLIEQNRIWQRNIYGIHISYVISYAIYGALISTNVSSGFFYHTQVVIMSLMVLYVGYSANIQPNVFSGMYSLDNKLFYKYEKSGLTSSLSKELMENLIRLFDEEKIYKENNLSLEMLAGKLNTTRHNTSQVINEHFNISFHELVNKYRIKEAKEILDNDSNKNLNIIDIVYEVGYNNKVTFNKAFKKETQLTPSEYQKGSNQNERFDELVKST